MEEVNKTNAGSKKSKLLRMIDGVIKINGYG